MRAHNTSKARNAKRQAAAADFRRARVIDIGVRRRKKHNHSESIAAELLTGMARACSAAIRVAVGLLSRVRRACGRVAAWVISCSLHAYM